MVGVGWRGGTEGKWIAQIRTRDRGANTNPTNGASLPDNTDGE